jgi:hypothetical protein
VGIPRRGMGGPRRFAPILSRHARVQSGDASMDPA